MKTINFEEFIEQYEPIKNHLDENASYNKLLFETFGKELEYVKSKNNHNIWTLIDCDDEESYIIPGFHIVNRVGYFVTEVQWNDENLEVDMNESVSTGKAKYAFIEFLEENNLLTQELEDKLHDYWSNKF